VSVVVVWRLSRQRYAGESYSGEGSRQFGGRWSPIGLNVAYSAESRSLAALEVLVNVRDAKLLFAQPWVMISAKIPGELIERPTRVPDDWRATPYTRATQTFGAEWVRAARSAVLRVPSTVVLGEFNYLLNPAQPDFARISIGQPEDFTFDPRFRA
jgi:RES domain-containing protein